MKRLKYFFATILLLLALPFWRNADYLAIFSPYEWPFQLTLVLGFCLFVLIPLKLIFKQIKTAMLLGGILGFGIISWMPSPYSDMSTQSSEFRHCGFQTWAGAFYHLRVVLSEAHADDLEARNQMCWIRKMITRVPNKIENFAELDQYLKIVRGRLITPPLKYRTTLPLISILFLKVLANYEAADTDPRISNDKIFIESLDFWRTQYTEMISERKYGPGSFPHSQWIKWEYGIIERNWDAIVDSIEREE
jgi:hypothetical protein